MLPARLPAGLDRHLEGAHARTVAGIRVGIIGFGAIGRTNAEAIAAVGGRVVAVAGRAAAPAEGSFAYHADHRELIARDDVDLVAICTPSGLHARQALDAIAAGKHVVIEKPLSLDLGDGERVIQAARERGVLLSVISQRRFEPDHRYLEERIASGDLGRAILGEAIVRWWREESYYLSADWRGTTAMDGGVLLNQAIHVVDLLRWLLGSVDEVSCATATLAHEIESEDTAVATIRFASGALGSVVATTAARPGVPAQVVLSFERGSVELSGARVARWDLPVPPPPPAAATPGGGESDPRAIGALGHIAQWRDITDALVAGRRPSVSGEDALATLALILAAHESARTRRAVRPRY